MPATLELSIDDHGSTKVTITKIRSFYKKILEGVAEETDRYAYEFRDEVRRHAEGRPGPRKVTGGYWDSIQVVKERSGWFLGTLHVQVVSDHPAAARLEKGYSDIDALGRSYNQPPFPHWDPAIQIVAPRWLEAMGDNLPKWWRAA